MSEQATSIERLGLRITERREALNLTRAELAGRAGMSVEYLTFLEEQPGMPIREAVVRLAEALGAGVADLLGDLTQTPAGVGPAAPHSTLIPLSEAECLRLLEPGGVGRIAFEGRFGPTVLPVNFRMADGEIVFRTATGGTTDEDLRTGVVGLEYKVAFEVDRIEELTSGGWSVLVQGSLHHVTEEEERAMAAATGVEPWAGGVRQQYLKVRPSRLSGRRIQPG
ncbi:helix-turn-helix domain-containing protein [Nonomuraea sp. NN258]|uniref:helix-turn-helix domain-containing protein n=1 Tax=Nonomuraea antri TaxID=2730852 RepID=UPI00156A01D7|nr:pyridoxamine 5'-phosphate oxidase family protein [Nonomuraea antri]NRQ33888.1 helix-turn-helix domain-containing protein [Nonomuraea antri]